MAAESAVRACGATTPRPREKSILKPVPTREKVGIHTLGEPHEYVYICCGPATFRVVNMNPAPLEAPVLTTTRA